MNDIILGQITCPKCGTTYPTTGDPCPHCNPKPIDISHFITPVRETVRISCSGNVDDNGTWDMAQKLMYVSCTEFAPHYNDETSQWIPSTYDCLILDFKNPYSDDFDEEFNIDPRPGYYTEEDIEEWRKTQKVVFPPIQVYSLKIVRKDSKSIIEIETDNAYEVRKLFYLFADLGNGGHSFDGLVRSRDDEYNVGSFGFDGDGNDRIYEIDFDSDL